MTHGLLVNASSGCVASRAATGHVGRVGARPPTPLGIYTPHRGIELFRREIHPRAASAVSASSPSSTPSSLRPEAEVEGMSAWLDGLKFGPDGLLVGIVQAGRGMAGCSRALFCQ